MTLSRGATGSTELGRQPSGGKASSTAKGSGAASSRQSDAYLSELLSYSLERLREEPVLLRDEKQHIERSLQSTAVSNYGAFIETARCLDTINTEVGSVCERLDALLQGIPDLASACESFSGQSASVMDQYAQNKQLAGAQSSLLEVLEVPQLMDTCVRNGIYDEALDLQAFVSRLALLHPDVPAVSMLMQQVNAVGQTMLQQLLSRLRTNLQLPECLRVMGYLRRIAAFSEAELRLQFLSCRDEWLTQLLDDLDESDSYEYLKQLTDVYRLHLFDAVMQYRAIFFDAPASGQAPQADLARPGAAGAASLPPTPSNIKETAVLYSWAQHRLGRYMAALRTHLPHIREGGNLASVLEHCVYCGSSLSRVGLDFTSLLHPLFEEVSMDLFASHLTSAVEAFNARLESHKWVALPTPMMSKSKAGGSGAALASADAGTAADRGSADGGGGGSSGGGADGRDSANGRGSASGTEDVSPPYVIMEHLPLAVFTNAVLVSLNELRHCALSSLARPASGALSQAMEAVAGSLLHYLHTRNLPDSERALFRSAVKAGADVVVPYLSTCFSRVFAGGLARLDTTSTAALLAQAMQEA